ncbi:MAG: hypothetical protein IPJ90_05895 [Anaerolineaceae bacterium]|nr:hypothetical protein [Anaerolineaceae bacterium]
MGTNGVIALGENLQRAAKGERLYFFVDPVSNKNASGTYPETGFRPSRGGEWLDVPDDLAPRLSETELCWDQNGARWVLWSG